MSGRGRGRGWLQAQRNDSVPVPGAAPPNKPPIAVKTTEENVTEVETTCAPIYKKIAQFNGLEDAIDFSRKLKIVGEEIEKNEWENTDVEELYQRLWDDCLKNGNLFSKYLRFLAMTASCLDGHAVPRSILLKNLQKCFENREQMQITSNLQFQRFVVLLARTFTFMSAKANKLKEVLAVSVLQLFNMLLISGEESDFEILAVELNNAAESFFILQVQEFYDFLVTVREALITDELSKTSKAWLTLALDFMNYQNRLLPEYLNKFYQEQLGKDPSNFNLFYNYCTEEKVEENTPEKVVEKKMPRPILGSGAKKTSL